MHRNRLNKIKSVGIASLVGAGMLAWAGAARADIVNAFLTVPAADSVVFDFEQEVPVRLILTDENNDTLRLDEYRDNGLAEIEIFTSGPRNDYHRVEQFTFTLLLSADNLLDRRYNPESGMINGLAIPAGCEAGSYTVLVMASRVVNNQNTNQFAQVDFRVGQARRTRTPFLEWNNCWSCHTPSMHETNVLANCVVCHAKDSNLPFQAIIHEIGSHPNDRVGRCNNCHKASAGLINYKRSACFSCHTVANAPAGHANYTDDRCIGCHEDGVYDYHQAAVPSAPVAFDLISPADGDTVEHNDSLCDVQFRWNASRDNDANDRILYALEIATNRDFNNPMVWDSLTQTSRTVRLEWMQEYWWRVRAEDLNTAGTIGNGEWRLSTWFEVIDPPPPPENHPPSHFGLASPTNGEVINLADKEKFPVDQRYPLIFIWNRSDVDSGQQVLYRLTISANVHWSDPPAGGWYDTTFLYDSIADTLFEFDEFSWGFYEYCMPGVFEPVHWQVIAYSDSLSTPCDSIFGFWLIKSNSVDRRENDLPSGISLASPHPNPFNSTTTISYGLGKPGRARITVYDVEGRPVGVLEEGWKEAGWHEAVWNAEGVGAGLYFVRLEAGRNSEVRKAMLVR